MFNRYNLESKLTNLNHIHKYEEVESNGSLLAKVTLQNAFTTKLIETTILLTPTITEDVLVAQLEGIAKRESSKEFTEWCESHTKVSEDIE